MLPKHIQKIMLSATIDSPERFANWVENIDTISEEKCKKKVYLCSTTHRVVPLTHYGFYVVNESSLKNIKDKGVQQEMRKQTGDIICLQNDKGVFQETGYRNLKHVSKFFEKEIITRKYVLNQLAKFLRDREMLPAIFFVFSRKNVEAFARDITIPLLEDDSKIPYIVKRECDQILRKLPNYAEYYHLPEYTFLVSLLEQGIGIHHSGMIPILREMVEVMISKKYIKILFATESFAIGLDCPIKTAVFTSLTKFDGKDHRWLLSHEYTQMAGRAGRRGIDTIGHVIHCTNIFHLPSISEYQTILCGKAQTLVSKFRISYSWVLSFSSVSLIKDREEQEKCIDSLSKKSMIYEELQKNIQDQRKYIASLQIDIDKKQENLSLLRSSLDNCKKYMADSEILPSLVNKKKKEKQREIQEMEMNYRSIKSDAEKVREYYILREHQEKEMEHLDFLETYMEIQIQKVRDVLINQGFLAWNMDLTDTGKMAAKIGEVHPLVWSKCILEKWNSFAGFSEKQIIGILSCITDIKIPEEYHFDTPNSVPDVFLKQRLVELQDEYRTYENIEFERNLRTGISYDSVLQFDIIEEAMKWCDCETEEQCKYFIYSVLSEKNIGIGDFTKAMLKIATIAREWTAIPILSEHTECIFKLSQIDRLVLKYIATNQSLYL